MERHLSNDRVPESKGDSAKPAEPTKAPAKPKDSKDDSNAKPEMVEFGAKNDYQLIQALNLLKGLYILHGAGKGLKIEDGKK